MRTFAVSALFAAIALADGHMPTNSTMHHDMDHHDDMHMEEGHMGDMEKMHQLEEMIDVLCKGMDMNHEDWTDDDHSGDEHSDDKHSDHDTTDHEGDMHNRMLAGHGDKDHDMDHDMDHHDMDHDKDHDMHHDKDHDMEMDHGHVKDMWLCMQAKQMLWDLEQYHMGGHEMKRKQAMEWRHDIKEMKRDWGMDGASNLAMAGAAMIAAVSALSF